MYMVALICVVMAMPTISKAQVARRLARVRQGTVGRGILVVMSAAIACRGTRDSATPAGAEQSGADSRSDSEFVERMIPHHELAIEMARA